MKLKNKVAIVTGGSRGIGEAICYAYAKEGAQVIVVNKSREQQAESVVNKICEAGGMAEHYLCDVSSPQAVEDLQVHVTERYDRLDILVNNAGICIFKSFEEQTVDYDQTLNTNLKSAFILSQAFVPIMKKQQSGKIIFVSSIAARMGFPGTTLYSASKGGMLAMMRAMVAELASSKININSISPGNVATEINQETGRIPSS